MTTRRPISRAALGLVLLAAAACTPGAATDRTREPVTADELEAARATLERERQRSPWSIDARVNLGVVYYQIARDALDRQRDEGRYLTFLERSVAEFVRAVEIDPRDDRPHFYLAMMDTYRGDLRSALRGFNNVRRLHPSGIAYTNIAEIYVYLGKLESAKRWNELGLRKGAGMGPVKFNDMLIAWKSGDLPWARSHFERLRSGYPDMIRTINVARLPVEPSSFREFAGYCCRSPACGPYMEDACREVGIEVRRRDVSNETMLRELRIEIEKRRALRKVYEQHKELEIEIGADEPLE